MVSVTVYDGAETIGGNKIWVENGAGGVFLDFGMNYSRYNAYFNEYLCGRDTRGIHDLLQLNLIPRLNIYREDLLTSDIIGRVRSFPRPDVKAVLLSHAHVDHTGNIGFLDRTVPVIASNLSLAILKAQEDVSRHGVSSETAYISPRKPGSSGLLCGADRSAPKIGRELFSLTRPSDSLRCLISDNTKASKEYRPGTLGVYGDLELPFEIEHYAMDHSISGATAYRLRSESGTIFYTGDFRLHGAGSFEVDRVIAGAKEAGVMIVEGTRTGREDDQQTTERMVYDHCKAAVESTQKLITADFSARNFERLEMFAQIANETGRQLVVMSRDIYMLNALECADGRCRLKGLLVYDAVSDKKSRYEMKVVEEKCPGLTIGHEKIAADPGRYILCFSFYDMKHLLDIKPDGGLYIYSSSEAFSEEQEIDHQKLFNWLRLFNIETCGIRLSKEDGHLTITTEHGYHASGHISGDDLEKFIDRINPDVLIPVHTMSPEWFVDRFHEKVVCLKDGQRFDLN